MEAAVSCMLPVREETFMGGMLGEEDGLDDVCDNLWLDFSLRGWSFGRVSLVLRLKTCMEEEESGGVGGVAVVSSDGTTKLEEELVVGFLVSLEFFSGFVPSSNSLSVSKALSSVVLLVITVKEVVSLGISLFLSQFLMVSSFLFGGFSTTVSSVVGERFIRGKSQEAKALCTSLVSIVRSLDSLLLIS